MFVKARTTDLREVWFEMQKPEFGLLQAHRYRLRSYPNTLVASEIVDWLVGKGWGVHNRNQATLIGQALLDSKRIEHIAGEVLFKDEYALYRPGLIGSLEIAEANEEKKRRSTDDGPEWFRSLPTDSQEEEIPIERSSSDSKDNVQQSLSPNGESLPVLSVDTESESTEIQITAQTEPGLETISGGDIKAESSSQNSLTSYQNVNTRGNEGFEQRYLFTSLHGQQKQDNFECILRSALRITDSRSMTDWEGDILMSPDKKYHKMAFDGLNQCHKHHFAVLLRQQLQDLGLPKEWFDIVHEIAQRISRKVRPDYNTNDQMDVRKYVKYKKIPDKSRSFSYVSGVVFTKTVAHKKMASNLHKPKILLLRCALEYERVENKFSSLDSLVMQERQHLQSLVDRIKNLHPNIVVVEKSVSQLARGFLLDAGIVVVFNVKAKVMERLARSTQATLVIAIDQLQFDQVRLGTCEHFKLTEYPLLNGKAKTLMSFEGCPEALCCTVIIHGDKHQLPVVKQLLSIAVVTAYSLLMERHLQLDIFAMPPTFDPDLYCEVESALESRVSKVSTPTLYPCIPDDEYQLSPCENLPEEELSENLICGSMKDKEVRFDDVAKASCAENIDRNCEDSSKELEGKQGTYTAAEGISVEHTNSPPTSTENLDQDSTVSIHSQTLKQPYDSVTGKDLVDTRQDPLWTIDPSEVGEGSVDTASTGDISSIKSLLEDQLLCSSLLQSIAHGTQFIVATDDKSFLSDVYISHLLPERPSCFLRCLMQVLLTLSPHMVIPLPYTETAAGSLSKIRPFIPNVVYFSKRFKPQKDQVAEVTGDRNSRLSCASPTDSEVHEEIHWGEPHPFITEVIKEPITDPSCAARLAHFRAVGGRVGVHAPLSGGQVHFFSMSNQFQERKFSREIKKSFSYSGSLHPDGTVNFRHAGRNPTQPSIPRPVKYEQKIDCLDINNHQRFLVLFSSRSFVSNNAPNPCVHPMVVTMVFYGKNDIALGGFLTRFCFRMPYLCVIQACGTDMIKHQRHFVHGRAVVHLEMQRMEKPLVGFEDSILCWTWCKRCKQLSPVSKLSKEAQAFSFAKYLELRFYARNYTCYQLSDLECHHSLHQDHVHFFNHGRVIASFEHQTIGLLEVIIPAIEVTLETHGFETCDWQQQLDDVSVYFTSFHKLVKLRLDDLAELPSLQIDIQEQIELMKKHLEGEKSELLKNMMKLSDRAEQLGLIFTGKHSSPQPISHVAVFEIIDACNELKRACVDRVNYWNRTLYELHMRKSERGRRGTASRLAMSASTLPLGKDVIDQYDIVGYESSSSTANPPSSNHEQSPCGRLEGSSTEYSDQSDVALSPAAISALESSALQREQSSPVVITESESEQASVELPKTSPTIATTMPLTSKSVKFLRKSNSSVSVASAGASEKSKTKRHTQSILSRFLPDSPYQPVISPIPPTEHHGLPMTRKFPVPVYENEPSSIVAYTLSSKEYFEKLKILQFNLQASERSYSDQSRLRLLSPRADDIATSMQEDYYGHTPSSSGCTTPVTSSSREKDNFKSTILNFFRSNPTLFERQREGNSEEPSEADGESVTVSREQSPAEVILKKGNGSDKGLQNSGMKSDDEGGKGTDEPDLGMWSQPLMSEADQQHINYQYTSDSYKFYCRVFFAEQFRKYREVAFPDGEDRYARSLSRCCVWAARGGRSGLKFCKTFDDRFIVKQLSRTEMQSFMQFAQHYFEYMENAHCSKVPTVITKILGVYRIGFENSQTSRSLKQDILIMENLFYGRRISRIFDLKGSERNRYVQSKGQNDVLMDENLLEFVCESPLFIRPHAKNVLTRSILNDTEFLAKQFVMDYSLLVGIDETQSELVVGIIDFIRTFTLDKRLEMWVKSTGLLGGHGKMPTVVSPDLYRKRFCEAMDRYFLMVPDKWSAVGADVDWQWKESD
jgi:1-phosphatidylinositol-3-phosphate 5-kinase